MPDDEEKQSEDEEQEEASVEDEEEESPFSISVEDEEEEEEEDKEKKDKTKKDKGKKAEEKPDDKEKKIADLEKEVEKLKKDKNKAFYEARQLKKEAETTPPSTLTDTQIKQILNDNKDDPDTLFNVVKYVAEQTARGISTETVNTAEMNRKKTELDNLLAERYPDINEPGSDIRIEVDQAKKALGLEKHPYGDYFAVASRVLEDLPQLLEHAYNEGKGKTGKEDVEEKRKQDIKAKKLPASKKREAAGEGLTSTQLEAAKQMGLKGKALETYKKLVGKNPRVVSVEE